MNQFYRILKGIFFWRYERTSWQWDVLCVVILVFIFLTPKGWFETGELRRAEAHQNQVSSLHLLVDNNSAVEPNRDEIERRVRIITKRPEIKVTDVRPARDEAGRIVAYEVDFR